MGVHLADPAPPRPPVGRQESRHLLCELSDHHHHLMGAGTPTGTQCATPAASTISCTM